MEKMMKFPFATAAERDAALCAVSKLVDGCHKISTCDASSTEFLLFIASTKSANLDAKITRAAEACRCN